MTPPRGARFGIGRSLSLGAAVWTLGTVQFFVAHVVVQRSWNPAYSWSANNISDLGNVGCGPRGTPERYICSPLHGWMSASFVVHGVLIVAGVLLLRRAGYALVANRFAAALLSVGGLGWIGVGLAPADTAAGVHFVSAAAGLVCGTLGLAVAALVSARRTVPPAQPVPPVPTALRALWLVQGLVGLTATALFGVNRYLGLGMGGMERVAAFELTLGTLVAGLTILISQALLPTLQRGYAAAQDSAKQGSAL